MPIVTDLLTQGFLLCLPCRDFVIDEERPLMKIEHFTYGSPPLPWSPLFEAFYMVHAMPPCDLSCESFLFLAEHREEELIRLCTLLTNKLYDKHESCAVFGLTYK